MNKIPPYLNGLSDESFAAYTIRNRLPAVINDIIADNMLSEGSKLNLVALHKLTQSGTIISIPGLRGEEQEFWNDFFLEWEGYSFFEAPFFMIESYFYRKILEAIDYFQNQKDPFLRKKLENLEKNRLAIDKMLPHHIRMNHRSEALRKLLKNTLWGNTADLSQFGNYKVDGFSETLIDRTNELVVYLESKRHVIFDFVLDNAGLELVSDLCLAVYLLEEGIVETLRLHVKQDPIFVSDAIPVDIDHHLDFLETGSLQSRTFSGFVRKFLREGRMVITSNAFWNSPLHFTSLPEHLADSFRNSSLLLFKGDANYRRIFEDRNWAFTEPVETHLKYFQCPVGYVRILKSEIILGLDDQQVNYFNMKDKNWLTNGTCGVVDFLPMRHK